MIEKIHPGAIAIITLAGVVFISQDVIRNSLDREIRNSAVIFIGAIFLVSIVGIISGRTQGFSYLLDSMILAPLSCLIMFRMSHIYRARVLSILMYFIIINDIVVFVELFSHRHILPYPFTGLIWRPAALLGHPLTDGLATALAIPFVWIMRWSTPTKLMVTLFLVLSAFAAGARMASIFSVISATASVWVFLRQSAKKGTMDDGALVVTGTVLLVAVCLIMVLVMTTGLAERLVSSGLYGDESAQSRFTIYRLLGYLSWNQLAFGVSREWAQYITISVLNLPRSESPIIDYIVEFGLIGTSIIVPSLLYFLWTLARFRGSPFIALGVGTFVLVASTNNEFASKSPILLILTAITIGARSQALLSYSGQDKNSYPVVATARKLIK